jgi:hypothetical protein
MRYPYVSAKLGQAATAATDAHKALRDRLYAAHLQLHTVLPEDFPDGPLRAAYASIHDRLTKFHPDESHEESVIAVLCAMSDGHAEHLIQDIGSLDRQLTAFLIEGDVQTETGPRA